MQSQLSDLLDARTNSENKLLHDELRRIRGEMQSRGMYTSSIHVNSAIRACCDYMERYVDGAVDDYKRANPLSTAQYGGQQLSVAAEQFVSRIQRETSATNSILSAAVGEVAGALSNHGLLDYSAYDNSCDCLIRKAQAEIDIYNAELLAAKPTFLAVFKDWWERKPIIVTVVTLFLVTMAMASYWKTIRELFR